MVATSDMLRILRGEIKESECMYVLNGIRPKNHRRRETNRSGREIKTVVAKAN